MPSSETVTNWAGNVTFSATRVHRPATVDELRRVVAGAPSVRVLGSGHSFNRIADADAGGALVSVAGLPAEISVDHERSTVTVAAGLRYAQVAAHLQAEGLALANLASLPHISVTGACATATHGSGDGNRSLASAVAALDLVGPDGDLVRLSREADGDAFHGAAVNLGALGVVTAVTLDVEPTFDVAQHVYTGLALDALAENVADVFGAAYSVSAFTDWHAPEAMLWLKRRCDTADGGPPARTWFGATPADRPHHPVPGVPATHCTEQLGVPGPWHERLPHFRPDFTPSSGEELQSEFFLPREAAPAAFAALRALGARLAPVLQVSELRTVAAEELWLSPAYHRDSLAVHLTWIKDPVAVAPVLAAVEEQLAPLGARPHWGKLFSATPGAAAELYERASDFRKLMDLHDPAGKFRNAFVDSVYQGGAA
ncbi:xylitol oxidase [Streptacidiphilus sp. MAP12-16]|uniref:FAD-binding protein n=1 Tax=Streptacidiphilus sp. MAP12-16 TaxID=3156300 RepID=UPI003514688C